MRKIIAVLFGLLALAGCSIESTPTDDPTGVTAPATIKTSGIKPGTYEVGPDIKPGKYKTSGAAGINCYWARLADLDGDINSILANANTTGPAVVTIKKTDAAFETTGVRPGGR